MHSKYPCQKTSVKVVVTVPVCKTRKKEVKCVICTGGHHSCKIHQYPDNVGWVIGKASSRKNLVQLSPKVLFWG